MRERVLFFVQTYRHQILTIATIVSAIFFVALIFQIHGNLLLMEKQIGRPEWRISSTVFAEGPTLFPGAPLKSDWVEDYLHRLKYSRSEKKVTKSGQYGIRKDGIVFLKRDSFRDNEPAVLISFDRKGVRKLIQEDNGVEIPRVTLDPLALTDVHGSNWEKHKLLQLKDVPEHVRNAVIAIEDRRFYKHGGVDVRAIVRAACSNIFGNGKLQGASTITQQVVKNFYLTPQKSLRRKLIEATMAIMMERKYTKDKILEFYLNNVYMGRSGSFNIRGFQEASRMYFKKDVQFLNVAESALLAGMIQAPLRYDPYEYPEKARTRRDTVLLAMTKTGAITDEQYKKYSAIPIHVATPDKLQMEAPYFVNAILRKLPKDDWNLNLESGGYQIYTTLDVSLQKIAEESLSKGLSEIDKRRPNKQNRKIQGCLIAVDPATGYVRALVGGRDFSKSQFNRVTQAKRHPGSSFKPFVYATALESAFDPTMPFYSPSTLIADEPLSLQVQEGVWEPQNYNRQYYGVVTARQALTYSMNVATARLAQGLGIEKISRLSKQAGLSNARAFPSLALGAFEVTPWDLISAYTVFANGGKKVDLTGIRAVYNSNGEAVYRYEQSNETVLHEETAYVVTDMLKSVVTSGTAASMHRYGLSGPIAGKTGTSNEYRDAWFVGYTSNLICLVWVGYDDNTPIDLNGAEAALPIWSAFMKKALGGAPIKDFHRPSNIVERVIDPTTGKLATWDCWDRVREIFIQGTEPQEYCTEQDHLLPPESFAGPKLRSTPVPIYQVMETQNDVNGEESTIFTSEPADDAQYADETQDVDETQEPASLDEPFVYIAAPDKEEKQTNEVPEAENNEKAVEQIPNETEYTPDSRDVPDSQNPFQSTSKPDPYTIRSRETSENQNLVQPESNEPYQQGTNEKALRGKERKRFRPPKNIDQKKTEGSTPPQF